MKINIKNLIIFIIIIMVMLYCLNIKKESFTVSSDVSTYYPIDTEPINVDKYMYDFYKVLEQSKIELNNELYEEKHDGYSTKYTTRPYFNTASLPINRQQISVDKVMPLITTINNRINKIFNKNYTIKFNSATDIYKEETEFDIKLTFTMLVDLSDDKKILKKNIELNNEIIIKRELPDDIFLNPTKIENYYIVDLSIKNLNTYLSGIPNNKFRSYKQPYDDADFNTIVKNSKMDKQDLDDLVKQFL